MTYLHWSAPGETEIGDSLQIEDHGERCTASLRVDRQALQERRAIARALHDRLADREAVSG